MNGNSAEYANGRFYDTASQRLRELWRVLGEKDRVELRKLLSDIPTQRQPLRLRGLVTSDGLPFGRVLKAWLSEVKS